LLQDFVLFKKHQNNFLSFFWGPLPNLRGPGAHMCHG